MSLVASVSSPRLRVERRTPAWRLLLRVDVVPADAALPGVGMRDMEEEHDLLWALPPTPGRDEVEAEEA